MERFNSVLLIITSAMITLCITGCYPVMAVTTAKVGTSIAEERSTGNIVDDGIITTKIKNAFVQKDFNNLFSRISVVTTEGRVLLTGSVSDHKYVIEAVRIAWSIRGVTEVLNEIEVANKSLKARASDAWISTQIKTKYLLQEDFRSLNYTIDVNNGVVFLLGIAQDEKERDIAINIAKTIKGVTKVVSHVTLKNDPRREEEV